MLDKQPRKPLTRALALVAAGALSLSLVAESAAQRGFAGGGFGGRGMSSPGNIGGGRMPGGDGPRYPGGGGMGPIRPGGVIMLPPGGYGPGPGGPGTVVVVDDDNDAPPQRRRKTRQTKKHEQKQQKTQKQIAQRSGFNPPPPGEHRFVPNEVLLNIAGSRSSPALNALARRHRLTQLESRDFTLPPRRLARLRINDGRPVAAVIRSLQQEASILAAQPNYYYSLEQGASVATAADPPQYVLSKMRLPEAHGIATGKNVKIAVIDSGIDGQHPDLQGVIAATYDALPSSDQTPHPHGTGMAGAIGSHQRLLGIAPGARILGVRAFGVSDNGAQGTSMNIVKGLEWAVQQGAQVINMSFAGPRDPILEQAIKSLKDRGIIMIAATGNAGPKSPPLFPGADVNVIGVSATDVDDKTYKNAVRGKQVAIAAPGVDILVPAPAGGYQLTTGTSVAAAHISGVVALMLERNPRLTPADVRAILSATAKKLPQGRNETGAGLVDPVQALSKSGPKQAQAR